MFRLWVENEQKEKAELTNSPYYESVSIEGLLPTKAIFSSTKVVNKDGEVLNNATGDIRDITIIVKPAYPVEENRQKLYKYFKKKKKVNIYFKNENRNIVASGNVEDFDGSLFEMKQTIIIYIKCFDSYLKDSIEKNVYMSTINDLFEFPFSIEKEGKEFSSINKELTKNVFNEGDTGTGLIIEMIANGVVVNPKIYNAGTKEYFGLNITMQYGDMIRINTNTFNKRVELVRYGVARNIINNIMKGNTWFILSPGDNIFTYICERGEEYLNFNFKYSNLYEGV